MTKTSVISFLLGVAVAAVFYEATGIRVLGDRAPQLASSGATSGSPSGNPPPRSASAKVMPTSAPAAPRLPETDDSGHAAKLQADLSEAQMRASFAEQQLEAVEGRAIPWPQNVAPVFKRESVEKQLREFVVERGLGKLKSINCAEYPCVEVLQVTDASPEGARALHAALNDMVKHYYQGKVVLSVLNTRTESGSNAANYAGISVVPNDADTKSRARYRTRLGLEEYAQ